MARRANTEFVRQVTNELSQTGEDFLEFNRLIMEVLRHPDHTKLAAALKEAYEDYTKILTPHPPGSSEYPHNTSEKRRQIADIFFTRKLAEHKAGQPKIALPIVPALARVGESKATPAAPPSLFSKIIAEYKKKREETDYKLKAARELSFYQKNPLYNLLLPEMTRAIKAFVDFCEQEMKEVVEVKREEWQEVDSNPRVKERWKDYVEFHRLTKFILKEMEENPSNEQFPLARAALRQSYKKIAAALKERTEWSPYGIFDELYKKMDNLPFFQEKLNKEAASFGKYSKAILTGRSEARRLYGHR